jgi:pSer/pThr/pTyr-binding forkhead associated (FHA) protein/multidrug efflux pump subunit AcrA (membrane-fusion protein)
MAMDRFPAGAYRANLYVYDAFGRIEWFALLPQSFANGRYFTIGRGDDCDITLDDGAVSSRHAFIAAEDGELIVRDLRSTNGTTVNKIPLTEHVLTHGDVIRMGASDIRFLFSYRESPVHLVLDFKQGPNAGKTVATFGASTNIGRLNCAINLQGRGIATQHVRVDAFGAQLLYVVNLHPENDVFLNGERVERLAPARQGDLLTVGEHEIMLRIADPSELLDAVPMGDGTLQVAEDTVGHGAEPIARMSATDMRLLSAHIDPIDDAPAQPPKRRPSQPLPEPAKTAPPPSMMPPSLEPLHTPPPRVSQPIKAQIAPGPPPRVSSPLQQNLAHERPPERGKRRMLWAVVLGPALLVGLIVGAFVVRLPESTRLDARLVVTEAPRTTVQWPAAGRIDRLHVQSGQQVVIDEPIADLTDLTVEKKLQAIDAKIVALQSKSPTAKRVRRPVPASVRRRLREAKEERESASIAAEAARAAFERRELSLAQYNAAQKRAERTRRAVYAAQTALDEARRRWVVRSEGGLTPADETELVALKAEKTRLQGALKMTVKSTLSGTILSLGPTTAPQQEVAKDSPLMVVQSGISERYLRIDVPEPVLQSVESVGKGVLKADGVRPINLRLSRAEPKASKDGSFPMRVPVPPLVRDVLRADQPLSVEVDLPDRRALFVLWDRLFGD